MNIRVNDEEFTAKENQTVSDLLSHIGLDEEKVMACAINGVIIKKDVWHTHKLEENDSIELLNFVGGG